MLITILFGGTNKERLVSVATAQALCEALPEADLWAIRPARCVGRSGYRSLLSRAPPAGAPSFRRDFGERRCERRTIAAQLTVLGQLR